MTTASLNGIALSTITGVELLRVVRPFPTPRHRPVDVPGRAGSIIFPEEPGDRIVTLELHLLSADYATRRAAVRELAAWAVVGDVSALVVDDEPDRYEDAILEDSATPDEWLEAATIVLPFRCGPYALALASSTEALSATTNPDSASFTVPDNVEARPVIELTPAGGTLTSFALTVNGFVLNWTGGPITAGSTITVSSLAETITLGVSTDTELTGAYNPAQVAMEDASGFFPLLTPGSNDWILSWTGTATSVALDVEWRERFL